MATEIGACMTVASFEDVDLMRVRVGNARI